MYVPSGNSSPDVSRARPRFDHRRGVSSWMSRICRSASTWQHWERCSRVARVMAVGMMSDKRAVCDGRHILGGILLHDLCFAFQILNVRGAYGQGPGVAVGSEAMLLNGFLVQLSPNFSWKIISKVMVMQAEKSANFVINYGT